MLKNLKPVSLILIAGALGFSGSQVSKVPGLPNRMGESPE